MRQQVPAKLIVVDHYLQPPTAAHSSPPSGKDHKHIVQDESLGSSAQGSQALRPVVPPSGQLVYIKLGGRLGYGEFAGGSQCRI